MGRWKGGWTWIFDGRACYWAQYTPQHGALSVTARGILTDIGKVGIVALPRGLPGVLLLIAQVGESKRFRCVSIECRSNDTNLRLVAGGIGRQQPLGCLMPVTEVLATNT